MKKSSLIFLLVLSIGIAKAQVPLKTNGTAYTIGYKKAEISLFQYGRYGSSHKSEINIHPIAFFMMPHIHYKYNWTNFTIYTQKIFFSSRHGIYYPTILLNFTRNQPWIPENYRPVMSSPHTIGFQNEIIFSSFLKEATHCQCPDHLLTLKIGAKYSYSTDTTLQPIIYKPVLFRETSVLNPELLWYVQFAATGHLNNYLNYMGDFAFHAHKINVEYYSAESKLGAYGNFGDRLSTMLGVKLIYTNEPNIQGFSVYPLVNLYYNFRIKGKKRNEDGLFKRNRFHFQDTHKENEKKEKKARKKEKKKPEDGK